MSTGKEQPQERRKFPFLEAYEEEAASLPPLEAALFRQAVNEYGLKRTAPDFEALLNQWPREYRQQASLSLCVLAWHHVEKWLNNGWSLSEKRSHPGAAGAPRGNQNARKKKPSED